jgi:hypothetical protein
LAEIGAILDLRCRGLDVVRAFLIHQTLSYGADLQGENGGLRQEAVKDFRLM